MILSLITGTLNRPDSLNRLIASITRYTTVEWELIVADASDKPLEESANRPNIRVLRERPRLGCTKGYNRAFCEARGEWVIWLNDDAEVLPNYAEEAVKFMEAHPKIGLGALPYSNRGGPFKVNQHVGMIYANFGIISKKLGDQVGWFDEDLVMYGNDNSITFRVLLAGFGVAEIPNAKLVHHEYNDAHRRDNQKNRIPEANKLMSKYWSPRLRTQLLQTYNSHRF